MYSSVHVQTLVLVTSACLMFVPKYHIILNNYDQKHSEHVASIAQESH